MLLLPSGPAVRSCDSVSRRGFLRVGALGLGGLTLPALLRARALGAATDGRARAVIQVVLAGAPSPFETFDPKPDAPSAVRGEARAIATRLPGVFLAEHLPRLAERLDRMALVRGMAHDSADHTVGLHQLMTGYPTARPVDRNERPSVGSVAARLLAPAPLGVPPYVLMPGLSAFDGLFGGGAYLGPAARPFELAVGADAAAADPAGRLALAPGLTPERLRDRRALLADLDRFDRRRDPSGGIAGLDEFGRRAYDMVAGPAARRALDLTREPPATLARYGRTRIGRACLLARRLVEAGGTFVTITDGDWDHHARVDAGCARQGPPLDAALAALVDDLADRGLLDSTLVVAWGEFGRTPRLNGAGGRDHWPQSLSALVAGGGTRPGVVVGESDATGERAVDRPWRPEDLIRTIYHALGVDPARAFPDEFGRPLPVLDRGRVITPLI